MHFYQPWDKVFSCVSKWGKLKIDKLSWRVDYAEDLEKRYVLSLDLNVDVDVRERSEGGNVFQNVGAYKEKALFCEDDERRGGLSSLNWCIVRGLWMVVHCTICSVLCVLCIHSVLCTMYHVQCT